MKQPKTKIILFFILLLPIVNAGQTLIHTMDGYDSGTTLIGTTLDEDPYIISFYYEGVSFIVNFKTGFVWINNTILYHPLSGFIHTPNYEPPTEPSRIYNNGEGKTENVDEWKSVGGIDDIRQYSYFLCDWFYDGWLKNKWCKLKAFLNIEHISDDYRFYVPEPKGWHEYWWNNGEGREG